MIAEYFKAAGTLERMRMCCLGPYLDDLACTMAHAGYASLTICAHLRTAVQFARWTERRCIALAHWDESILPSFRRHLLRRKLGKADRALGHVKGLLAFLRKQGLIAPAKQALAPKRAATIELFANWMLRHRGITPHTLDRYSRVLDAFVAALGEDPSAYDVAAIRAFVVEDVGRRSADQTREAVIALRSFLRFLVAERRVPSGLEHCVPTVPQWSLSTLPRYLEAPEVERVVSSCDLTTGHGLRDHAVLLLLSRLGLRAGDIVGMMLDDIDWTQGTLRVRGKSHREAVLPLPQDVGDALLAYLKLGRPSSSSERVFLTVNAPTRPFASSSSVSDVVRFALVRAGVRNPPSRGAHLLRHSAATAMLRAGSSLDTVAAVLRHQSQQTTVHYAKVDFGMLQHVVQPWPGGA